METLNTVIAATLIVGGALALLPLIRTGFSLTISLLQQLILQLLERLIRWLLWGVKRVAAAHQTLLYHLTHSAIEIDPTLVVREER